MADDKKNPGTPAASIATPPDLKNVNTAKKWVADQAAATKDEKEKAAWNTLGGAVDEIYAKGIQFNFKDGKLDLSNLDGKVSDDIVDASNTLAAAGKANAIRPAPSRSESRSKNEPPSPGEEPAPSQSSGGGISSFLSNNTGGLIAGLLAMGAAMMFGEMGLLGGLIMGLVAFAAVAMMTGGLGGLFGGGQERTAPARGKARQHEIEPEYERTAQVEKPTPTPQVVKNGQPIGVDENGRPTYGKATDVTFVQVDDEGKPAYLVTGKVNSDNSRFDVSTVAAALPDGSGFAKPEKTYASLTIDGNDQIDLRSKELDFARKTAERKVDEYTATKDITLVKSDTDPSKVTAELGKTKMTVDGKEAEYTVKLHGISDGSVAQFSKATLIGTDGKELTDSKGKVIELPLGEQGLQYAVKDNNIQPWQGRAEDFTKQIAEHIVTGQKTELAQATKAREEEVAKFTKVINEAPSQEDAIAGFKMQMIRHLKKKGVDDISAIHAAEAVADQYAKGEFRGKSVDEAARDIAANPDVKKLGGERAKDVVDIIKQFHEPTALAINAKPGGAEAPRVADVPDGTNVAPGQTAPVAADIAQIQAPQQPRR